MKGRIFISAFTQKDTLFAKGIALCLLLIHHLFYEGNIKYPFNEISISGHQLFMEIGQYSKVCVAIFVILSGYGLSESIRLRPLNIKEFYLKHLSKIYMNYWFTLAIFVPIGVLFFNRSFIEVYKSHIALKLLLNVLGFQQYFGYYGYNPTWWFISAIIALYLIFPFLRTLTVNYRHYFLVICFSLMFVNVQSMHFNPYETIKYWIFPFVFGIYCSENNIFYELECIRKKYAISNLSCLFIYIFLLIMLALQRTYGLLVTYVMVDTFFGFTIILIGKDFLSKSNYFNKYMVIIGKHSFNIFLFHTFIYAFYFTDFIYLSRCPPIIFLVLLISCLFISLVLEKMKQILNIYILYQKIINIRLKSSILVY